MRIITFTALGWVLKMFFTGLFLGLGFATKEYLVVSLASWKQLIDTNLEEGRTEWAWITNEKSRFFNPAYVLRQERKKNRIPTGGTLAYG